MLDEMNANLVMLVEESYKGIRVERRVSIG